MKERKREKEKLWRRKRRRGNEQMGQRKEEGGSRPARPTQGFLSSPSPAIRSPRNQALTHALALAHADALVHAHADADAHPLPDPNSLHPNQPSHTNINHPTNQTNKKRQLPPSRSSSTVTHAITPSSHPPYYRHTQHRYPSHPDASA